MGRQTKRTRRETRIGSSAIPADEFDSWWNATEAERIAWPSSQHDPEYEVDEDAVLLTPGLYVNGQAPIIPSGAEVTKIVKIECHCGRALGRIMRIPPIEGRRTRYYADVLLGGEVVSRLIRKSDPIIADCPDDGTQELPGDALLRLAMRAEQRMALGTLDRVLIFRAGRRS